MAKLSKNLLKVSKILLSGKVIICLDQRVNYLKKFSKKFKINFSCAISNGSVGLELALIALDIKRGDEVLVPSRSYFSSASSILRVGAKPVFVDLDLHTMNISQIKKNITKKTKAIICVHLYGMLRYAKIHKVAKNIKLKL